MFRESERLMEESREKVKAVLEELESQGVKEWGALKAPCVKRYLAIYMKRLNVAQ